MKKERHFQIFRGNSKHGYQQWKHIDSIEKDTGTLLITAQMTPRTEALRKKLYAVLTSRTKGRPLRAISKVPGQKIVGPREKAKSQVRNFHLLQNINFKSDSGRSLNENVLAFEQLVEDYKKISNVTVGSETKLDCKCSSRRTGAHSLELR